MSSHEHSKQTQPTHYIACNQVVPDCGFTASADTEDDLIKQVVAHAEHAHGVTEVTPELAAKVKAAIQRR